MERPDRLRTVSAARSSGGAGTRSFREDRGRMRRRVRLGLCVLGLCGYGLARIWLSTEVAACGSRVTALQEQNDQLSNDLAVSRATLGKRSGYDLLMGPAEALGFGTSAERRIIRFAPEVPVAVPDLWAQVGTELRAGTRLIWSEALAQDPRSGSRSRGQHP